jgi:hypothetical protein
MAVGRRSRYDGPMVRLLLVLFLAAGCGDSAGTGAVRPVDTGVKLDVSHGSGTDAQDDGAEPPETQDATSDADTAGSDVSDLDADVPEDPDAGDLTDTPDAIDASDDCVTLGCPGDLTCVEGRCVDLCADVQCRSPSRHCEHDTLVIDSGAECIPENGQCTGPAPYGERCDPDSICADGACRARLPLADFSLGPYPHALPVLLDSLQSNAAALDTSTTYGHAAAQGYLLQAISGTLSASSRFALPGGAAQRDALVALALAEVAELRAADGRVLGGGPAFGLDRSFDAFGDGSVNPPFTAYSWQSGMVALGVAELLTYLHAHPDRHADVLDEHGDELWTWAASLVAFWDTAYTAFEEDGQTLGFFWYSPEPVDARAVHNTSALIAMAAQLLAERNGENDPRSQAHARLLRRRMTRTRDGVTWNYVDDGHPEDRRRPEDVSHALITLQFMRFAHARGWWSDGDLERVAGTLTRQAWSGHPGRLHGFVDGSSGGDSEWTWSAAATVGYAAHASGPRPEVFDYARSLLVSSYMTPFNRPLEGARVDAVRVLALARLFEHRPPLYAPDSTWSMVPGPGDDALPAQPGGVRFYTVDWSPGSPMTAGGLTLPARLATARGANFLVDLRPDDRGAVVSLTYTGRTDGLIQQWDGERYHTLATLPATLDRDGVQRWMRTTVTLLPDIRFDYQRPVPGDNVLIQLTPIVGLHRLEATPLP